jgi:hypothetical protein
MFSNKMLGTDDAVTGIICSSIHQLAVNNAASHLLSFSD